jgi:hypothetical protein
VPIRVSPTERICAQIDVLFGSDCDLASVLEEVARLDVRLVMQAAMEAEVAEFFGRDRYERHDGDAGHRAGHAMAGSRPRQSRRRWARWSCRARGCGAPTRRFVPACSGPR